MKLSLTEALERCKQTQPRRVAVAAAGDSAVLMAIREAGQAGIIHPILCGDVEKIDRESRLHNIDLSAYEIIEAESDAQAVSIAVSLVRRGQADFLMKGLLHTAELLKAVLDKENGLRESSGILSHVALLDGPHMARSILMTDPAFVPYPDLNRKVQMINNAVRVAHGLGIEAPLVAPLAAVEVVNPAMQATLDAAALTLMNRRGQIKGCVIDGPLALDAAVSEEAARHKGIDSPVAGKADILLFHNIEAANSSMKAYTANGCVMGGVVMGASAPILLNSRSDSPESKLFSIALACLLCQ